MKEPRQVHRRSSADAGFSLIELIIVLALVLIIFVMYWNHGPSKRDRELTACRLNLEKIYLAMQIYSRDFPDKYPASTNALTSEQGLAPLVPRYTSDTGIFICPATSAATSLPDGKTFGDWKISYAYYMGRRASETDKVLMSDGQINSDSKRVGDTVFSETGQPPGNNHGKGGGNFMMGDGSVVSTMGNAQFPILVPPPVVLLNPRP
jgi:prepilin-type N-terminal cleavage/methylation domain-containing protein